MRPPALAAAAVLAAGAAGCGPTRIMVIERGQAAEYTRGVSPIEPLDLVACLVPDNYDSFKSGRRSAVGMARVAYAEGVFNDLRENYEGLESACDLKLVVYTNNLNHLRVVAARSGRQLFDIVSNAGGYDSPLFRSALYRRFADDQGLLAELQGARTRYAARAPVPSPAPPAAAEPPPEGPAPPRATGFASDVERPSYQLAERPQDYAIVVGIEKYQDLPPARFAERDARAVKSHLMALGVPERNIVALTDQRALRSSLEKYVEQWLPNLTGEDSRVYFYFSGHGAPDARTGESYLVPWEGDPNFLSTTAYPVKRLYQRLGALKSKRVLVALDACFSGAGGRSVLPPGARPLVTRLAETKPSGAVSALAAAAPDEITTTVDGAGHGAFTYYLLKGLDGSAARSGHVTLQRLFDYLKPLVQTEARRVNRDQTPQLIAAEDFELR